jgi:thioester reductase-like protein
LSNLTGTRNLLQLCRETGVRQFDHVSTAYVCGKRPGPVFERELDCGQTFRNDYERSKCEAEKLVRAAAHLDRVTVYRPAIIVGDSRTGYTTAYHGPYAYF